jgi:glycerophosphoryl diester phosphodiesterase
MRIYSDIQTMKCNGVSRRVSRSPWFLPAVLLWGALSAGLTSVQAVDIVAHRGASFDAPENTVASARLGWEQGADAVEIDIYLTADGRIAVLHDPDTKRTTGVSGRVAEMKSADLWKLDAGSWKGPELKDEKLPSLEPILKTVPAGKRLFIEIKCGPEILPELARVLREAQFPVAQTVLIGFGYETMVEARHWLPGVPVYWLSAFKQDPASQTWTPSVDELIRRARIGGFKGVDIQARPHVDDAFVRRVKDAGLECHVWTVDDAAVAKRMKQAGVNSITTNRPRWLREQLARP